MGVHLYRTLLPVVLLAYVRGETCEAVGDGWASLTLDDTISYVAYHKVVDGELHLRLSAAHSGWLGFGFAEPSTGHMKGADLVTVSVSNSGMVTVDDRYAGFAATTYTPPTYLNGFSDLTAHLDVSNDWTIVSGQQESGVTNVWIKRALVTNDSQDRTITAGMTRVVWSYGSGDSVSYHGGNRGTLSTIFFGTDTHAFPAYDGKWTRRFTDYAVPGDKITTYACQSFTFPTDKERHIVALRPIGVTKYNHHAILHICTDNAYFSDHTSPQLCSYHADNEACPGGPDGGSGSQCQGSSPLGSGSAQCAGLMWSWAVGMGDFILPPEAGLRTGASQISHVVLEIHYDNPDLTTGVIDRWVAHRLETGPPSQPPPSQPTPPLPSQPTPPLPPRLPRSHPPPCLPRQSPPPDASVAATSSLPPSPAATPLPPSPPSVATLPGPRLTDHPCVVECRVAPKQHGL